MVENSQTVLRLEQFLPYRLFVIASRISSSLARHYEKTFNITRPEWRVLAVLAETPNLSALEVGERTAMDKVAVSRAISKLVGEKYLKRDMVKEDKRRSKLCLTEKGKRMYKKIVPIAKHYEAHIMQQFSSQEIELLRNMLTKLDALELDIYE
ncbi:HTH-type transcriptional regulator TcaR [Thalassocella blandensis]|nr:HTH-type transcriptional regulator TcaR [Thalassocella blandensis]